VGWWQTNIPINVSKLQSGMLHFAGTRLRKYGKNSDMVYLPQFQTGEGNCSIHHDSRCFVSACGKFATLFLVIVIPQATTTCLFYRLTRLNIIIALRGAWIHALPWLVIIPFFSLLFAIQCGSPPLSLQSEHRLLGSLVYTFPRTRPDTHLTSNLHGN
jgi:hypothetical protein